MCEACCKMLAVFEKYGPAIDDLFGNDEEFNEALEMMRAEGADYKFMVDQIVWDIHGLSYKVMDRGLQGTRRIYKLGVRIGDPWVEMNGWEYEEDLSDGRPR